ncbi:hypothetical protein IJ531_03640 [bacterium]|nr:hypothetical protein [bacterium]
MPDYKEQLGFRQDIEHLIQFSMNSISNKGKRCIVLFVDNLDRCSSDNIKSIIDSICQFLEMCETKTKTKLVSMFAVDKNIVLEALLKEGVPPEKINSYLEKIITLPIYLLPEDDITVLIKRLFADEEIQSYLIALYNNKKFNLRRLSNLRYWINMIKYTKENITIEALKSAIQKYLYQ